MISAVLNKHILVSSIMITVLIIFISSIFVITTAYGQDAAPTADAGPTQTVNAGDMVTLDAGNSNDPDGDNLNYHWRQVTGKNVMLSDIHIANPTFNAPNVNSLTHLKFALLVDDGIYNSSPSSVEIVVNPLQKSSAAVQSDSNSSQSQQSSSINLRLLVFLLLLFSAAAWYVLRGHRKHRERRYFPESVKRQKLHEQNYKCIICKRSAGVWDYDHIDGDRSNNNPRNLQALCPTCHAKKSRGLLKQEKRSSFSRWLKIAGILFFIILLIIVIMNNNELIRTSLSRSLLPPM